MRPILKVLFCLLVLFCGQQQAFAQLTITNFKINNATSVTVYTTTSSSTTYPYTASVKRPQGSVTSASVDVYPENGSQTGNALGGSFGNAGNWTWNADGFEYATITGNVSLSDGSSGFGTYTALRLSTAFSPQYRSSNTVQLVRSSNPPSTAAPFLNSLSPNLGQAGTYVTIIGSGLGDATGLTFNGVATPIISTSATNLSFQVPSGATTGNVVVTNPLGTSNGLLFTVGNPPATTGWCNLPNREGSSICGTQFVAYTTAPRVLLGQKAEREGWPDSYDWWTVYRWEYNYSGNANDWHTINGAESRDFQPWDCWQTVHYRRVILKERENIWGQLYHDAWATSNEVTVTPSSPPPTPTQASYVYYACANVAGTFTISFTPGEAATSSNWSLPDASWTVNGVGNAVIGVNSYNVGAGTSVTIGVPANVPPGTYQIHTSSTGPAGTAGYRVIQVAVDRTAPSVITGLTSTFWNQTATYTLAGSNSSYIWTPPSGWSITSGQGTASVRMKTAGYDTYSDVEVAFTDQCGTPKTAYLTVNNVSRTANCRICPQQKQALTVRGVETEAALYPNPAATQITLAVGDTQGQATIYDSHGTVRKAVTLRGETPEVRIDIQDLPEGLYHVRIVGKDQQEVQHQLQIRR